MFDYQLFHLIYRMKLWYFLCGKKNHPALIKMDFYTDTIDRGQVHLFARFMKGSLFSITKLRFEKPFVMTAYIHKKNYTDESVNHFRQSNSNLIFQQTFKEE